MKICSSLNFILIIILDSRKVRQNRFKWRQASLRVLKGAFERDPKPKKEERELLAAECNLVEDLKKGVDDLVTEMRVYYWFSNRRKAISKNVSFLFDDIS